MTPADVVARVVPANVREVCARLAGAGHQAVTVGGAVRDALLGRAPGDWDVATSARPDAVLALFRHTIPTGLQHGTVTVVTGRGVESHVEVTTFRGEGAYTDARRPDTVTFGVPLVEDLARRDLVVNAIAFDPTQGELIDPFDGQGDLARRVLRAVGDPVARFTEDGLRVMRAVRFAAALEFALDPATEAGIGPALPSLAKVSRERVSDELRKLLAARQPSRGLDIAVRTGIIATIAPELAEVADAGEGRYGWIDLMRVDRAPQDVRLAAMFAPLERPDRDDALAARRIDRAVVVRVQAVLAALKFSNAESELAATLVGVAHVVRSSPWSPAEVRRTLAELDRARRAPAVEMWASAYANADASELVVEARRVLAAGEPLSVGDLAIGGRDLLAAGVKPGPIVGRILALLLARVIDDPAQNSRDVLLAAARDLALELG